MESVQRGCEAESSNMIDKIISVLGVEPKRRKLSSCV